MTKEQEAKIKAIITSHPEIKLAYLFGSQATGNTGPMSDYDFAIYIEPKEMYKLQYPLIGELCSALKTNAVDVTLLNDPGSPELKYAIISEGIILYEEEPYRLLLEPLILNDYFDFRDGLRKYGLTQT